MPMSFSQLATSALSFARINRSAGTENQYLPSFNLLHALAAMRQYLDSRYAERAPCQTCELEKLSKH